MTTMRRLLLTLVVLAALAAPAAAQEPAPAAPAPTAAPAAGNPLSGVNLEKYKLERDKGDIPVEKGRLFLDDLKVASPDAWASVVDAIRFEIQKEEAEKFARQKNYVIYAYGALWVILLLFVIGVFTRQRHLAAELAELERRVGVEKK